MSRRNKQLTCNRLQINPPCNPLLILLLLLLLFWLSSHSVSTTTILRCFTCFSASSVFFLFLLRHAALGVHLSVSPSPLTPTQCLFFTVKLRDRIRGASCLGLITLNTKLDLKTGKILFNLKIASCSQWLSAFFTVHEPLNHQFPDQTQRLRTKLMFNSTLISNKNFNLRSFKGVFKENSTCSVEFYI